MAQNNVHTFNRRIVIAAREEKIRLRMNEWEFMSIVIAKKKNWQTSSILLKLIDQTMSPVQWSSAENYYDLFQAFVIDHCHWQAAHLCGPSHRTMERERERETCITHSVHRFPSDCIRFHIAIEGGHLIVRSKPLHYYIPTAILENVLR